LLKSVLLIIWTIIPKTSALLKTCSPSFHESFLSGGDEISMRWEYCTRMTFSKNALVEWHSWATYRFKDYY